MQDDDDEIQFRLSPELIELIKIGAVDQYSSIRLGRGGFLVNDQPLKIIHEFFTKRDKHLPVDDLTSARHTAFEYEQEQRTRRFIEAAAFQDAADLEFISLGGIQDLLGISRSTLHRLRRSGNFPAPAGGGKGSARWRRSDVVHWFQSSNFRSDGPEH